MNAWWRLQLRAIPRPVLPRCHAAGEPVPAPDGEQWATRSRAVLEEARQVTALDSNRRWTVVHPGNAAMHALVGRLEAGGAEGCEVETPRVVRWHSKIDGRLYMLVEFFRLTRQVGPAR